MKPTWVVAVLLLLVAACVNEDESASEAPEPADGTDLPATQSEAEPMDLVVIGDSFVAWSTWPEIYASMIEAETGAQVDLHLDLAVAGSGPRLDVIKDSETAHQLIRSAEVIVLEPEPGAAADAWSAFFGDECGGDDGLQCFRDTAMKHRTFVDEYLDLLAELAQPGAIVRVALTYTWPLDGYRPSLREDDPDVFGILIDGVVAMRDEAEASAHERGIPTIDVGAAFNGPDYRELAPARYLVSDRVHLAEEGSQVVANLLHDLGYEATTFAP